MIDKNIYGIDYIRDLQTRYLIDPGLLERTIYAFGLLEAITAAGLPFCFKGGTSLMLILDKPIRLSTDIDIMVNPGTKVDSYIEKASKIFPFINMEENIRRGSNDIEKRHFKFTYLSPIQKRNFYILLDIVYAQPPYVKTVHKEIKNDLLLTTGENLTVEIPTPECILADKLTAFAPHTTGVLLGEKKELEIAKQLFDITNLIDHITDYQTVLDTYCKTVADETRFRGEKWTVKDVLEDTIDACLSILSRGRIGKEDYKEYLHGIKSLKNYVLLENYSTDNITWETCKVMYLASCLLSEKQYQNIKNSDCYITEQIENPEYVKLTYIRKQNLLAYAYLVEAVRNLAFVSNISLIQQEQITKK